MSLLRLFWADIGFGIKLNRSLELFFREGEGKLIGSYKVQFFKIKVGIKKLPTLKKLKLILFYCGTN